MMFANIFLTKYLFHMRWSDSLFGLHENQKVINERWSVSVMGKADNVSQRGTFNYTTI